MSPTIAIISEYNPFHNGHEYQIKKIRESFPDATIIAIMSGNVTQRGEFSLFDKYTRARCAGVCGVNAIFEIPYPYSASNAEIYANAGVSIANSLDVDYLCFGSESGDLNYLIDIANAINSEAFEEEMKLALREKNSSYISIREKALKKLGVNPPNKPNDMLAVEYLRALQKSKSKIKPYVIKRIGSNYNDLSVGDMMSASAIREFFCENKKCISIPKNTEEIINEAIEKRHYLNKDKAEEYLFHRILMSSKDIEETFDLPEGGGFFIQDVCKNSNNFVEFFESLTSKTFTYSRLRRIVMYYAIGIKQIDKTVNFTILLFADYKGRELIKKVRKNTEFSVVTKHADVKKLNEAEKNAYNISKKADELYFSFLEDPIKATEAYKKSAIII